MSEDTLDKKYVVFKLEEEFYGIDIKNVQGIEKVQDFTIVPNAKYYIKGVINLRGEVVPIIDLRKRFGIEEKEIDSNSRIIVVFFSDIQVGILVDSSSEVIEFGLEDIDSSPSLLETEHEDFVKGIGKEQDRIVILLSTEKILDIVDEEDKKN